MLVVALGVFGLSALRCVDFTLVSIVIGMVCLGFV